MTITDAFIALISEGLDVTVVELRGMKPPPKVPVPPEMRCRVKECERARIARGLCATHYHARRRNGSL